MEPRHRLVLKQHICRHRFPYQTPCIKSQPSYSVLPNHGPSFLYVQLHPVRIRKTPRIIQSTFFCLVFDDVIFGLLCPLLFQAAIRDQVDSDSASHSACSYLGWGFLIIHASLDWSPRLSVWGPGDAKLGLECSKLTEEAYKENAEILAAMLLTYHYY